MSLNTALHTEAQSPQTYSALDPASFPTLVHLLQARAELHPERRAYTFLTDGETEELHLTYGELDRQARAIAAHLQTLGGIGERVLLIYPQGLDYIAAFFGCLYAGMIAIPVYPPSMGRNFSRLQSILEDASSTIALTTSSLRLKLEPELPNDPAWQQMRWLPTDLIVTTFEHLASDWKLPEIDGGTLSFFQYTSGSTGKPKGVMIDHAALLHHEQIIQNALVLDEHSVNVSWLPLYHDLGLIGCVLQTIYLGGSCVLMSPVDFLQRPFRWLQAISRYQGTFSGGPNFAYDLCARKITPEQKKTLDLSTWRNAFNGAEPVRSATLQRFADAFAECGFRAEAMIPCYGLAENTLMLTYGRQDEPVAVLTLDSSALEEGLVREVAADHPHARELVGCGYVQEDNHVVIVDPTTGQLCPPDHVGEIWTRGKSMARGYWNREAETREMFGARLADGHEDEEATFLKTGDLGFLHRGQIFVAGRLKDLILIRGRNYYPQDLELTTESAHPNVRLGCTAAFSIEGDGEEKLVIAAELDRIPASVDASAFRREVTGHIRRAIAEEHQLQTSAVVLLKAGTIPKTSSGKIQRHACRNGYLARTLDTWGE